MTRNIAERRHYDQTKAMRKYKIYREVYPNNREWADELKSIGLHIFSKNKIHCSCWMCRAKTKYDGYKHSDLKKIEKFRYEMKEAGYE